MAASSSFPPLGGEAKVTSIASLFDNPSGGNLASLGNVSFVSLGHNLFSDKPAVALSSTDLIDTDPLLGALANNGGPTETQALLPGSPAINAGVVVPGVTTDQRGVFRPQGVGPEHWRVRAANAPQGPRSREAWRPLPSYNARHHLQSPHGPRPSSRFGELQSSLGRDG